MDLVQQGPPGLGVGPRRPRLAAGPRPRRPHWHPATGPRGPAATLARAVTRTQAHWQAGTGTGPGIFKFKFTRPLGENLKIGLLSSVRL